MLFAAVLLCVTAGSAYFVWPWWRATHYLIEARRAMQVADAEGALRALESAERVAPNLAEVAYLRSVALRRAGLLQDFERQLQRAAELGWPEADLQRQSWLAIAQSGDVPAVQRELMALLAEGAPDEVAEEVYEAVARGHLITYRLRDAELCINMWLQWRPDAPQARVMRASLYEQYGDYGSAAADYRAVLSQFPKHREARRRLAQALAWQNKFDQAAEQFEICLSTHPNDAEAILGLARCRRRQGNAEAARSLLEQGLAQNPPPQFRGLILTELGRVYLGEGKTAKAVEVLNQALAILPGEGAVHHALGTAMARIGDKEKAQYHHQRLREIQADYTRLNHVTQKLLDEPNNADLRCEAGEILIREGLKKEGAEWLLTALKCDPNHRKSHQLLAEFFAEIGNRELAARHRLLAASAEASPPTAPPDSK